MEYKIFNILRLKIRMPYSVRIVLGVLLFLISLVTIILPLPFSVPAGLLVFTISVILLIPGRKIKYLVKLRKGLFYALSNIHRKNILIHKKRDISLHVRNIIRSSNV